MKSRRLAAGVLLAFAAAQASADEGMWTFNHFPSAKLKAAYGFEPTPQWLDHLRLASVRLANGCSGSIVSPQGLVMTNHHCAVDCLQAVAGLAKKDYVSLGFNARSGADEARCPGLEVDQLLSIDDVTARVQQATQGIAPEQFAQTQKAAIAAIEKDCAGAQADTQRCDVVSLYHGGRYDLYRYRRFQDVRLVFAPEQAIAYFGGDPDNFMFPRYDLDVAFLRLYGRDGKPVTTGEHLAWSNGRLAEGDLTIVAGNPGHTSREMTVAQRVDARDRALPLAMMRVAEERGLLAEYQQRGAEQRRHSADELDNIENTLKVLRGHQAALADEAFFQQLAQREQALRERVAADPALKHDYGDVWDQIAALTKKQAEHRDAYAVLERFVASDLLRLARDVVRYGAETVKPNGERLKEFTEARLPHMRAQLLANRPFSDEFETTMLAWWLTKLREDLGPDHPAIKQVFGLRSPAQIATAAVRGTQLKTLKTDAQGNAIGGLRKSLLDGGPAAIAASKDPMLELARALDPYAREVRRVMETEVEGPMRQQEERLAKLRFAVEGTDQYPDATFTARVSYGSVQGWAEPDHRVPPFTTLGGAFQRHTGAEPFALPPSWLKAKDRLDLSMPFNLSLTNDIVGGNSGSPVVDRRGEVVGLVFDGNIHSLGGEFGFDPALNRAVAVHSAALIEALDKVYGAHRVVQELRPTKTAAQ